MLFKKNTLDGIKSGEIHLAFRKWKRPTIKKDGTILTRVGQLRIVDVKRIEMDQISKADLLNAGIEHEDSWRRRLERTEGDLYRIELAWAGEDPRIELRNQPLSSEDFDALCLKLNKIDKRSTKGPWTFRILELIKKHPGRLAQLLADEMGVEKKWLKPNIRKLKAIGLTISLDVGYKLSVRGESLVDQLKGEKGC